MTIQQVSYFTQSSEITAVEHMRIFGPLHYAGIKVTKGIVNGNLDFASIEGSQAYIFQRDFPKHLSIYRTILREAESNNIPLILDLDDNLLILPKEHPDRISGYYSKSLVPLIHALYRVDAVFVTNENLANFFSTYNKQIFILPNYLDEKIWKPSEIYRSNEDPLELMFMGTSTHTPDLLSLTGVFKELSMKYPNIRLVTVGIEPPDRVKQVINTKHVPKLSDNYAEFAQKFQSVRGSIAIAPLVVNDFNRGKSPVKYFEYSAVGLPAVYSNIESYSKVVQNGKTGFLANSDQEWFDQLEKMINDGELRKNIARRAQQDVYGNWNMKDHAENWRVAINKIVDSPRREKVDLSAILPDLMNVSEQLLEWSDLRDEESQHLLTDISILRTALEKREHEFSLVQEELNAVVTSRTWQWAMKVGGIKDIILQSVRQLRSIKKNSNEEQVWVSTKQTFSDQEAVLETGLFDEGWYVVNYPDVLEANINPLEHYLVFGGFEGKNPGPSFDSNFYLQENADVVSSRMNPLVHYALIGRKEGRSIMPDYKKRDGANPVTLLKKAFNLAKNEGFGILIEKTVKKLKGRQDFFESVDNLENANSFDVSIVIPAYNASFFTVECIKRLYEVENSVNFEVILIDNHSTDDTKRLMKKETTRRPNFAYYQMEENLGFSGGVNAGINLAKGKYVVILNNDTKVTNGWLDRLVDLAERNPEIGIISPITNYVGEGPQIDPGAVELKVEEIDGYANLIKDRDMIYEPRRLVFFCVLIRRVVVDHVGLLDEGYIKGNFEDDDYCARTLLTGYHLAIARNCFVYHHGSITFKKNRISHTSHMELNRKRFYTKVQRLSVSTKMPSRADDNAMMSIVVRTLNRPKLLTRALTSLSNQTNKKFEVVLVNDGGVDVQDIVDRFSKFYKINYIHHLQSKGRTQALNAGVKGSSTEWISFLDDDDIVYPWHVDIMLHQLSIRKNEKFFYSDYNRSIFNDTIEYAPIITKGIEPWEYCSDDMWVTNRVPIHTWLISKDCFNKVGFFDETQIMLEDFEFLVRLNKFTSFNHINAVTCEYRFYLDGVNSMINHREKTMDALKYIYEKHPAKNTGIDRQREMELSALKLQIEKIRKLKEMISKYPNREQMINRQITALILGF